MTKPKNRSIPRIPKPATPPGSPTLTAVETKPASELTRTAIALLQEKFNNQAEVIASQAAKAEGIDAAEGWKLDLSGVWFRPKPPEKPAEDKPPT